MWQTYVAGQRLSLTPSLLSKWNCYTNCCPSSGAGDSHRLHLHIDNRTSQLFPIAGTNHQVILPISSNWGQFLILAFDPKSKLFKNIFAKNSLLQGNESLNTCAPLKSVKRRISGASSFKINALPGQFSGSSFQIIPVTFWPILQSFTLDEGIGLCGKGLCCPDRGGEALVSLLLPIWQRTHSVIGANNRPEHPSPVTPKEEAEDFRATDSGVMTKFFPWLSLPFETNRKKSLAVSLQS